MNELVDGVPNAEAAIAYALKRWGYRQGTKECVAFYRGACWLQLASIPPITPVEAGKVGVASGVPVVDKAHERIAFEAWCERRGRGHSTVLKFDNGDYRNETAREEWRGWLGRATHPSGVRVVGHACKLDGSICESRPDRCSDCPAGAGGKS